MSAPPPYNAKTNEPLPSGYYHEMPNPNPTVQQIRPQFNGNPTVTAAGRLPVSCNCPYCHTTIVTRTEHESGAAVWLSAILLAVFGCVCGCCLIPFCIDDLKDTIHYCPNCNRVIAQDKKL